ncbi:dnaJ homolog subfamily C member 4 isoform X3 [Dasypus novemcinctus]|uniref:dnaJ homolog subfamily C member 4 isoform X3 n=1 Tax=Dasypus novemcinctus TaxID=9361 RepID=UPI00265FA1BE|nr:dnaJ homolog subfamily C member 4 isoform X2 [Dasypus novemcinctus]
MRTSSGPGDARDTVGPPRGRSRGKASPRVTLAPCSVPHSSHERRGCGSVGGPEESKANGRAGAGLSRTSASSGYICSVGVSEPMRIRGRGLDERRKWRPPRRLSSPASMPPLPPLPPLRLCRLWPRSPPARLLGEAAGQRSGPSNYYELLGVHPGASTEEVKRAFFTKSKELHPDRDPRDPSLHSRFVELSEAYRVLSHEQSRHSYDHQLRSASPPKSPGTTAHPRPAHQAYSSWEPPNAHYWAQFHGMRPQGPESRQRQRKHNQRVLGYCLLLMLAGMGLHYAAFRKLEQVHRSFMDEKDRIITAIYNDSRARARANRARLQQERQQRLQEAPRDPGIVPPGNSP